MNSHHTSLDTEPTIPVTDECAAETTPASQYEHSMPAGMPRDAYLASCLERAHLHLGRALIANYRQRKI